jgi:hypothetical protein
MMRDPYAECPRRTCDGMVYEHHRRGMRNGMDRFAEPDETWLQCDACRRVYNEEEMLSG